MSGDNIAKVSDFRLARERDFDHKGVKIPIKWTAPEAIVSGVSTNRLECQYCVCVCVRVCVRVWSICCTRAVSL